MAILFILFLLFVAWLFFKFSWLVFKIAYACTIGLGLAMLFGVVGIACCCTVLLIPLGKACFRLAGRVIYPF